MRTFELLALALVAFAGAAAFLAAAALGAALVAVAFFAAVFLGAALVVVCCWSAQFHLDCDSIPCTFFAAGAFFVAAALGAAALVSVFLTTVGEEAFLVSPPLASFTGPEVPVFWLVTATEQMCIALHLMIVVNDATESR